MAKVATNAILTHIHGKIGDLVFRNRRGKVVVYSRPGPQKRDRKKQLKTTSKRAKTLTAFADAVHRAKHAAVAEKTREFYIARAVAENSNAYNVAMRDALKAPVIHDVDLSDFHGNPGDPIRINVTDNVGVASVAILIRDARKVYERGAAVMGEPWCYRLASALPTGTTVKIMITARDHADSRAEHEQTWSSPEVVK